MDKGHGITQPSKYFGGEVRQEDNGSQAVIAIGKFTLVMVFCYIVSTNSKTFLVVCPRFWVVQALERLPTWSIFQGWQPQEGQDSP